MPEEVLENPLAVIGEEDIILGFKALGFQVYPVKEQKDFTQALAEVLKNKYAVCLLQDKAYSLAKEQIDGYRNQALPVFITFSSTGKMDSLQDLVQQIKLRATGTL